MSDIDLVVTRSQRLERLLERDFAASGRGLHEKVSSVADALPPDLVRKLRLVATVRNKVVHESPHIDDKSRFLDAADAAERELVAIARSRGGRGSAERIKRFVVFIILVAIVCAAWWWRWRTGRSP